MVKLSSYLFISIFWDTLMLIHHRLDCTTCSLDMSFFLSTHWVCFAVFSGSRIASCPEPGRHDAESPSQFSVSDGAGDSPEFCFDNIPKFYCLLKAVRCAPYNNKQFYIKKIIKNVEPTKVNTTVVQNFTN